MSNLVEIPASALTGRPGDRLQAVLEAEMRTETWSRRRSLCGRLVILVSVPMAYFLYRGQSISDTSARFALVLWLLNLACLIVCAVGAYWADCAFDLLLLRVGGRQLGTTNGNEGRHASP